MTIENLPTLETERLILRRFEETDGQDIYDNYASDPMVARYVTWNAHTSPDASLAFAKASHAGTFGTYQWAIVLKETGHVIGSVGLVEADEEKKTGEFGYVIGRNWWNKGITTEAMKEMLRYIFLECGFVSLEGCHDVRNPASGKVMEKCGFTYSHEEDVFTPMKNTTVRVKVYTQTAEQYKERASHD